VRLALALAVSTLLHVAVPATLIARALHGDLPEPFVPRIICVFPLPTLGQEVVSPEIRGLFLAPRASSSRLQDQLEAFTRAVMASPGTIRPVEQLDQAEVVVQFTDYSRKLTKEGEPQQRWGGHFKIVGSRLPERSGRCDRS
jgi:hypothetical protein